MRPQNRGAELKDMAEFTGQGNFLRMPRKFLVLLMLMAFLASPAAGFDTFWHNEAMRKVGDEFSFSEDARKIMQLGNFSPDFFGPVAEFAGNGLPGKGMEGLNQYLAKNAQDRAAAIFLHFDNLNGELDRNSKFDFIFTRLLQNTQAALAAYYKQTDADERTRKVMVLITLGASLHAVQDFYSHSNWVHQDFDGTKVKLVPLPGGGHRAPTWFEFRGQSGEPDQWPFLVKTGTYPPVADSVGTHTHMNHDNSRLIYKEYETAGQPLLSQAHYHTAGAVPALEQDAASVTAHQQFAFNTAVAASTEWVRKVKENAEAKVAIEFAQGWQLKLKEPKLAKELEAGLATQLALSCAAGKWDGEDPPGDRGVLCKTVLDKAISATSSSAGARLQALIIGLATRAAFPYALKYTGKFWEVHGQYHLLDKLTAGIAAENGHYSLQK
ncbi:MAG TPA: hypothetical protein VH724_20275 [Candidatus Angelobacter sp.]|nr:hypothetical protein [Candidatus Angelobacter sp.]